MTEKSWKKSKCWIWTRCTRNGYGVLSVDSKLMYAHRIAFALFNNGIPKNKCILHRCDNPLCYNPKHLFPGTRTENAEDRDLKGRVTHGAKHYKTTLLDKDIVKIRLMAKKGITHEEISKKFNVSRTSITRIVGLKVWKHIK